MAILRLPATPDLDNLQVSRASIPAPGPGEVLLRVHASSLNYHDYMVVAGIIPQAPGRVPLSDGAGEVAALGAGVTGLAVGDRVMGAFFPLWTDGPPDKANNAAIAGDGSDGFAAEYVVVPASSLAPMPTGWSFAEAATLPCAGLTAWRALHVVGGLTGGETIVLPGSGGLSVYALQLAQAMGLSVIVTSSSDEKLARLKRLGAAHGVNYRANPAWGEAVNALTAGIGADLVLDIGAASSLAQSVRACRMGGTVIVVGSTSNAAPELPLTEIVLRHIAIRGMAVGSVAQLRDLVAFVERHALRPVIDRTYPLAELSAAFRYQLTGAHLGKIAVTI